MVRNCPRSISVYSWWVDEYELNHFRGDDGIGIISRTVYVPSPRCLLPSLLQHQVVSSFLKNNRSLIGRVRSANRAPSHMVYLNSLRLSSIAFGYLNLRFTFIDPISNSVPPPLDAAVSPSYRLVHFYNPHSREHFGVNCFGVFALPRALW